MVCGRQNSDDARCHARPPARSAHAPTSIDAALRVAEFIAVATNTAAQLSAFICQCHQCSSPYRIRLSVAIRFSLGLFLSGRIIIIGINSLLYFTMFSFCDQPVLHACSV